MVFLARARAHTRNLRVLISFPFLRVNGSAEPNKELYARIKIHVILDVSYPDIVRFNRFTSS